MDFPVLLYLPELAQTHYPTCNKATTDLLSCAVISLRFLEFYIDGIVCVHVCVLVIQSCPTLSDPMDCSPPDSSVHSIFQARVLEWVAIAYSEIEC